MSGRDSQRALELENAALRRENEQLRQQCEKLAGCVRSLVAAIDSTEIAYITPQGTVEHHTLGSLPHLQDMVVPHLLPEQALALRAQARARRAQRSSAAATSAGDSRSAVVPPAKPGEAQSSLAEGGPACAQLRPDHPDPGRHLHRQAAHEGHGAASLRHNYEKPAFAGSDPAAVVATCAAYRCGYRLQGMLPPQW